MSKNDPGVPTAVPISSPDAPFLPEEMALLLQVPERDLFSLYCELDLPWVEEFYPEDQVPAMLEGLLGLLERCRGLPFSRYDQETLAQAAPEALRALARRCGLRRVDGIAPELLVRKLVRLGERKARDYGDDSQVPWLLPFFLPAILRRLQGRG